MGEAHRLAVWVSKNSTEFMEQLLARVVVYLVEQIDELQGLLEDDDTWGRSVKAVVPGLGIDWSAEEGKASDTRTV
jgi:hypothetical protein